MNNDLVAEWLKFADMDLQSAKTLLETMHPAPLEIVCYHCQQSAEKYLKSLLIHFGEEPDRTHDLTKLANTLRKYSEIPDDFPNLLNILTLYGVHVRYPNEVAVDEAQTKIAIINAEKVKSFAENILCEKEA